MAPVWSCVSFLNALPYAEGIRRLPAGDRPDLLVDPPFRCAERLRSGEAEVALVPSVELAGIPGAHPAGFGIASQQEVRSVVLLSRRPFEEIARVAVDSNSRTSVALLRLLLARLFGIRPAMEPMAPDPAGMLQRGDAALLIGDAALRASRTGLRVLDLASAWHQMTGLPFVFAIWAARSAESALRAGELLERSLAIGLEGLRRGPVPGSAAEAGLTKEDLLDYLTRNVHFVLGADEQRSLGLFQEMCRQEAQLEEAASG